MLVPSRVLYRSWSSQQLRIQGEEDGSWPHRYFGVAMKNLALLQFFLLLQHKLKIVPSLATLLPNPFPTT